MGWPVQPLLGCISVAIPAAPVDNLPGWTGISAGVVGNLLNNIEQMVELESDYGGSHRLYHLSLAEFLAIQWFKDNGSTMRNSFWTPTLEQHDRIIQYYLDNFSRPDQSWLDCDEYGLRQLVAHMQARLALAKAGIERREKAEAMYRLILNESFRDAQCVIGINQYMTFANLRTVLEIALERGDLMKALECVATYRKIKFGAPTSNDSHSVTITKAVFRAVAKYKYEEALQLLKHYEYVPKRRGRWERALQLYLAWEAAQHSDAEATIEIMQSAQPEQCNRDDYVDHFNDALLAHTAMALGDFAVGGRSTQDWLAALTLDKDAGIQFSGYSADRLERPVRLDAALYKEDYQLAQYRALIDEGNPEGMSVLPLLRDKVGQ